MATLEQVIIFFLLIGIGVIARKVGVITQGNTPQLTSLVFNFAMPAIILSGVTTDQPHISGKELSIVLASAFTTLILLIICSRMLARILRYEREYHGVITVMTTFTNVSMMGIPMIYSLYGAEAMIYITVFLLPYNLLFFSYGYYCMKDQSGNAETLSFKNMLNVINPGIVACILALLLYISNVHIPYIIAQPIKMLGAITGPVSMLLIGSFLLDIEWKSAFKDVKVWIFTFFKMVIIPLVIISIMKLFINDGLLLGVLLAAVATPAGAGTPLLAQMLNKKVYPLALKGATLTTLVSLITMPLVAMMTGIG
ncbi:AEC family transporter [Escherichia whittamii]|uniref:AEC family transporter n=1 Tax=Escherichia whittamii TaxID=2762229 RepID=A0ABR8T885_9ESCH|nr:AEC family transporter [Escherichia whittamii]MBD7971972.1 AEC family transporter [Escherichia whittamii]MCA4891656.1 AEC family transporter [Escherichia whittamii]MEB7939306.1 AEC family transporter [Escherichia whittamii]